MAVRASNKTASMAYLEAKSTAQGLKTFCNQVLVSYNNDTAADKITSVIRQFADFRKRLNRLISTPGFADFGKGDEDDQTYDVDTEYAALVTLLTTFISNAKSAIPRQGDYLLISQFTDNKVTSRIFTRAQLATLRENIQAIIDNID